jgi:chaperonin GroES
MKICPLSDNVLVKPLAKLKRTQGGILIPDTVQQKAVRGRVIAVGPGKPDKDGIIIRPPVKVGDIVQFSNYAGYETDVNEVAHLFMRTEDILGSVEFEDGDLEIIDDDEYELAQKPFRDTAAAPG